MAQIQNTSLDRAARYFRKKARVAVQGLGPSKIVGRFNGPVVIANSIPKSGTHLIENVFELIPGLRNAGRRTMTSKMGECRDGVVKDIKSMKRGAFYNAHLPGYQEIVDAVRLRGARVVFLIRDPRDIVVSRYKYVTYIDKLHPAHSYFLSEQSDSDRLSLSIKGISGVMPSIGEVLESFLPWVTADDVLTCRFEDLIGAAGGGSDVAQTETISRLISFLGYDAKKINLSRLKDRAFAKKTSTYRKGQIGGWRDEFEERHFKLFEREAKDKLNIYGYK